MSARSPLRPLARILRARAEGANPDAIEAANIRARHEGERDRLRARAEGRLWILAFSFCLVFASIGLRMGTLAATAPTEPRSAVAAARIQAQRADIVDRQGRLLATNLVTHALYAHPREMIDPVRAATALAQIFPDLDAARLQMQFTSGRSFVWVRRQMSPEQRQMVHEIGEPGLFFGPREVRLYPNGPIAAHVLGGASFGQEGVHSAEVVGTAGIERALDARLRDPALLHEPLRLTLDLSVQAALTEVLDGGMKLMNARGAAAVVMEADTGQIVAMASLPDFDPNDRPRPPVQGDPSDSVLFNRAVQGVYELGSVMKIFPVADAIDRGLINPDSEIDVTGPIRWGAAIVRDHPPVRGTMTVSDVIAKSSNIGTVKIAGMLGHGPQQAFLRAAGFFDPVPLELTEAPGARPLVPGRWSDTTAATVSYGHGLSSNLVHLAAAYAAVVNGGLRVTPTLVQRDRAAQPSSAPNTGEGAPERLISAETSRMMRAILRRTVTEGTGRQADVPGYQLAGKTGTAEKTRTDGPGYDPDRVVATFAGAFPAQDPRYVLVVSLDEGYRMAGKVTLRTAGNTAAPVTQAILARIGPLLGVRPQPADGPEAEMGLEGLRMVRN